MNPITFVITSTRPFGEGNKFLNFEANGPTGPFAGICWEQTLQYHFVPGQSITVQVGQDKKDGAAWLEYKGKTRLEVSKGAQIAGDGAPAPQAPYSPPAPPQAPQGPPQGPPAPANNPYLPPAPPQAQPQGIGEQKNSWDDAKHIFASRMLDVKQLMVANGFSEQNAERAAIDLVCKGVPAHFHLEKMAV